MGSVVACKGAVIPGAVGVDIGCGMMAGQLPLTASDLPAPKDPYGVSKSEAEIELRKIERDTDLDVVIVRPPLVYGPGVKGNFAKMLSLVHGGVPLPLGTLRNRRTMVSVWNLVDLLEKCAVDPRAAGALVLAGDAFSPSTPQLLREMTAAMGKRSRVFPLPLEFMRTGGGASRMMISG